MEPILLSKLKQLINGVYGMLVVIDTDKQQALISAIAEQIKLFTKQEHSNISKDLAKKNKDLFVLSSDNQSLRQKIEELDSKIKRFIEKLGEKEKQITKLMNDTERQKRQLQERTAQTINSLKKQISSWQHKLFETETKLKGQISDLRKIHKQQILKAIIRQQQIGQNNLQNLRINFAGQKKNMIHTQNRQKTQIIKKYEHKLQQLRDNHEKQIYKLTSQHNQIYQKDKKLKNDLSNHLFNAETNIKRLQGDLNRQTICHQKFKSFSQSLSIQIQNFHIKSKQTIQQLEQKLQTCKDQLYKTQKKFNNEINRLKQLLQSTIIQKDILFQQTVNILKNQHQDELQSIKSHLIEEKEIAINQTEIKHYNQIQNINKQSYLLQNSYDKLKESYQTIASEYQAKISQLINDYESTIQNIEKRNNYEITLQQKSSKKTIEVIERKYKLEIKSLKKEYDQIKQQLTKKINQEKLSITNKLTTQYQTIINDIKINNDVSIKQKIIEFDRKTKTYEKKLTEAEKRRLDLKIQMDRQKLQMQMKIDSLSQFVEKLESEVEELHHHLVKMQKQKTSLANESEFKLLLKINQLQQMKDDFEIKENQLRNLFNQHIRTKNYEIKKFSEKVTSQVQDLIQKHNKRVQLIQKQYAELKKIVLQRTSLPQDVQALKIFHQGYIQLEEQLEKQRQIKINLQRQLHSKCAIQKVFASKSFIPKVQEQSPIKVGTTMRDFHKKSQQLIKFKSQGI